MNRTQIIDALKILVAPYTEEQETLETLNEKTDFISDLKINSANLVDIVLDTEEKFGITINNEQMAKMLTVGATIDIIKDNMPNNNAGQ